MNETKPTAEVLIAALGEMTVDEIAEFLAAENIKGDVAAPRTCPVALYLSERSGLPVSVGSTTWRYRGEAFGGEWLIIPTSVQMFAEQFDHFEYPELVNR